MFSYSFYVNEQRENKVFLRLRNNRKKAEFYIGFSVTPEELENALSLKSSLSNQSLKTFLTSVIAKLDYLKLTLAAEERGSEDVTVIKQMANELIFGKKQEVQEPEKGSFITHYISFMEKKTNPGTKGVYKHTLDKMRQFDPKVDMKTFEEIDLKWLNDFEAYCAQTASKNARNIHLRNIRAVFNNALDYELTSAYPFRRLKIRPEPTEKRSLTVEELRQVFTMSVEPYQEFYRDMFKLIFMFIGINTVDIHRLERVEKGRIIFKRAKTGRRYSIKVEPEAQAIIDKYPGVNGLLSIADRWTDSRNFRHQLNKALQSIGSVERKGRGGKKIIQAAFPQLTSYWARHTWATIAADLDIPDAVISQSLGHAGENSTTEIYIKRNEKKVDEANRKVLDYVLYDKR